MKSKTYQETHPVVVVLQEICTHDLVSCEQILMEKEENHLTRNGLCCGAAVRKEGRKMCTLNEAKASEAMSKVESST